jgi:hypothetical protein
MFPFKKKQRKDEQELWHRIVKRVLQGFYEGVTRLLQGCYKGGAQPCKDPVAVAEMRSRVQDYCAPDCQEQGVVWLSHPTSQPPLASLPGP